MECNVTRMIFELAILTPSRSFILSETNAEKNTVTDNASFSSETRLVFLDKR